MIKRFREKFIGDRAFYAMVLAVSVPIMVQNGITSFVGLLDNIMVGRLGTEQMSSVSIVNQLIFVYQLTTFGGLAGVGIFTAQYFGQKDDEGIRSTFRYKLWMGLILTIGISLIFLIFGEDLIQLYLNESGDGGDLKAALFYGRRYLRITLLGLPAFMLLQIYAGTLRECGKTMIPMLAGVAAVMVNLIFNYLLIFGKWGFPAMGVDGAAYATVLARFVEMDIVIVWTHCHKKENSFVEGLYRTLKVPVSQAQKYFSKGLPLMLNECLWSAGMSMLVQCYSLRGLNAVVGLNIANTINNMFSVALNALGDSVAIIVGQLLGADRMKEARDTDNKLIAFSILSCLGIGLVMLMLSPVFPAIYNTTEEARSIATQVIIVQALFLPQNAYLSCVFFTLRAGGKTTLTFLYDCAFMWGLSVPVVYVLSRYTGIEVPVIYAVMQFTEWGKGIFGTIMVKRGTWLRNIVGAPEGD